MAHQERNTKHGNTVSQACAGTTVKSGGEPFPLLGMIIS